MSEEYDEQRPYKSPLLYRLIGSSFKIIVRSVIVILFSISSISLNFAQLVNFVLFRYTCPTFGRYINSYLQDCVLSGILILLKWNCKVNFNIYYANQETMDSYSKEHALVIGNHLFQIDTLFFWIFSEATGTLGSIKAYAKIQLRNLPIIGWTFVFGDNIFLRRNWKQDSKNIGPSLDRLMTYPFPVLMFLLPEGTRYTKEKYEASLKFAKENNLDINLKHHLIPRIKGFQSSLSHLQSKHNNFAVYHIELVSKTINNRDTFEPTLKNLIGGKPFKVDCYVERLEQDQLPPVGASDAEHSKFLYSVFEKKDKLVETYKNYHTFSQTIRQPVSMVDWHRTIRFIILNFGMAGSMVYYLFYMAIVTHSLALRITIYGLFISIFVGLIVFINMLQNSNYGKNSTNKNRKNNNNEENLKDQNN
ncbi:1-acyl-sn-glycerol-3-phosphate acyltransferase gamma [Blomia tropicalis]|nr:1-acyl-sn-glycerol-3-phosphate acyltransferase gamma [Blomia tropicalis]